MGPPERSSATDSRRLAIRMAAPIVLGYVAVASLWIFLSDRLLSLLSDDPRRLESLQTLKGWGFVLVTGLLLFELLRRRLAATQAAQESLRRSEARYRHLFEQNPHPMWVYDLKTLRFLAVNEAAVQTYGYSRDEFLAMTIGGIHPPEKIPELAGAVYGGPGALRKMGVWTQRWKDGTERQVEITTHDLTFAGHSARLVLGNDVTERLRAVELQTRLSTILEATTDLVGMTDAGGKALYINRSGRRMLGMGAEEEIAGLRISDFHPPWAAELILGEGIPAARRDGTWRGDTALLGGNGRELPVSQVLILHRDAAGHTSHLSTIMRDISDRQLAEQDLRRLNRTLRVLTRCNEELVRATEEKSLLDRICRTLVETGGYPLAWVGYIRTGVPDSGIEPVALAGDDAGLLARLDIGRVEGPTAAAIRGGRAVFVGDLASHPGCGHLLPLIEALGFVSAVALPLRSGDEELGALTIYGRQETIDAEELKILAEMADDLAYGLVALRSAAARRQAEAALRLRHQAIEASSNGIVILDAGRPEIPILYANPAFAHIIGEPLDEVVGRSLEYLGGLDRQTEGCEVVRAAVRLGRDVRTVLSRDRPDGSRMWGEIFLSPVRDPAGRPTHYVCILNDITERRRYEEQLRHQSTHDPLTGLANRSLLLDRIGQTLHYANRSQRLVAVLLIDLDRFKVVNDSLGHGAGDELLRSVSSRLLQTVREADTVARLGGDEFVIVLAEVARLEDVPLLIERFQQQLAAPHRIGDREIGVGASIGVSLFPRDGSDGEALVRHADVAMYRAKEEGGGTFRFYAPEMNLRVLEALEMEADLRRALERGELFLHYQPKVELASGRILGCEALVRWHHPQKGVILPARFVPLAEETGLILPLGDWVLATACAQARRWQEEGLPALTMAVNLSACQFRQADLAGRVAQILSACGLDPRCLELELTETLLMRDPAGAAATAGRLKDLGVGIYLDDFGTGFCSLNYLRSFPVDGLKIDRAFIADIAGHHRGGVLATSIVDIARNLRLTAVAEGVETREQLDFLARCGCHAYQGYYFSRPVPAEEVAALLRNAGAGI